MFKSVYLLFITVISAALLGFPALPAQAAEPVTVDNFVRAETDHYFKKFQDDDGAFGKLVHQRQLTSIDKQFVVQANRDTLYSYGVFDLTTPVTITLPAHADRFQSIRIINEDHDIIHDTTKPGDYLLNRENVGTRYVYISVRTLVNPANPLDIKAANAQQDKVTVTQADPGKLELLVWDQESLARLRQAILGLGPFVPDSKRMFGSKVEVDPVRHLLGTADGWGGGPLPECHSGEE